MNRLDRDIQFLAEIHQKANRVLHFEEIALREGRVSILSEDVTKQDLAALKTVVDNFDKRLESLKEQIKTITAPDALSKDNKGIHPDAKNSVKTISDYIKAYDAALASIVKAYGQVSFEKGVFNFGSKVITIPGMVTITTEMLEDVTALIKGYEEFKKKIIDATKRVPDDKADSSIFLLSQGDDSSVPDAERIIDAAKQSFGAKNALQKIVAGFKSFWSGAKSIGKQVGAGAAAGAAAGAIGGSFGAGLGASVGAAGGLAAASVKKFLADQDRDLKAIRAKVPQLDANQIGEAFGSLFVSVKISSLRDLPPPEEAPKADPARDAIAHAAQSVTTQGTQAVTGETPKGAGETENKTALSDEEKKQLNDLLPKLPKEVQDIINNSKIAQSTETQKESIRRLKRVIRESQLLTGNSISKNSGKDKDKSENYDRWAKLAGIK